MTLTQEKYRAAMPASPPAVRLHRRSRRTTRLSGVDLGGRKLRKGAVDAVLQVRRRRGAGAASPSRRRSAPPSTASPAPAARRSAVAEDGALLGVIHLKDVVKPDMKERFAELRRMGIAR